ncbi:TPA: hypothetical protein QHQ63_004717 [Klebsiella aerogenes]|nr:hypothetical protein [Klebsiella aerogenes]HDU5289860.1 hypothetical protein [Klebsiella aerogenes]
MNVSPVLFFQGGFFISSKAMHRDAAIINRTSPVISTVQAAGLITPEMLISKLSAACADSGSQPEIIAINLFFKFQNQ